MTKQKDMERRRQQFLGTFDIIKERKRVRIRKMTEGNNRRAKSLNDQQVTRLLDTVERLRQKEELAKRHFDQLAHKYSYENMVRQTAAQEDANTRIFRARYVARSYTIQQSLIRQSIEVKHNVLKRNQKMEFMESLKRGNKSEISSRTPETDKNTAELSASVTSQCL